MGTRQRQARPAGATARGAARDAYHHGDLREALLQAAETLLDEGGVRGLTLRACARRAGVSHAAPKHHFADMSHLLSAVAARGFVRLAEALDQARQASAGTPQARFLAVARTYVRFAELHPGLFRLMFRSDALQRDDPELRDAAARTFAAMTSSVTVQRGEPDATPEDILQFRPSEDLAQDILIAWSHIHGFAQLLLEGQLEGFAGNQDRNAFIERMLDATSNRVSAMLRGERQATSRAR
ncbi:MAG: WHG domain-containing protein [Pseudomonadales bacterium]